jgi:YegS/Rv2252/BmrU family lipid kinase
MKPIVCIVNPRACGGRADNAWPIASRKLVRQGFEFDTLMTTAPGDGTRLARQAIAEGATTVVAVGGDGTIHEVVNGFYEGDRPLNPDARLGILLMGTGSDLIKTFGIPNTDDGAIGVLKRDQAHAVDLARISFLDAQGQPRTSYFINTASAGLTGAVIAKMRDLPGFLGGSAAYLVATVQTLIGYKAFPLQLTVDGVERPEEKAMMVVIGNGRYFGGGMKVLPQASADDGLLDVLILKEQSVPELLMNFPKLYAGTHMSLPFVESVRARKISIAGTQPLLLEVDGEQPGVTPSTFEVVPQGLKVLM